ncbi:MAG: hypothetical protein IPN29_00135 [Saprospiraceae bacterium]|nr:hypothetical protein [Saprospiraceae bacterium]
MKKIAICTFHPKDSIPPRIRMEAALLTGEGHEVDIIYAPYAKSAMGPLKKLMFYLTLSYFRWDLIANYRKRLKGYDVVIIYDLYLLPLSLFLSGSNKKIIYETLDNNIELTFYNLKKTYAFLAPLQGVVIRGLTYFEKWCIRNKIHATIVNSEYLRDYFADITPVIINFYASPFEAMQTSEPFPAGKKPALLYLGIFSEEKGAKEVLTLAEQLGIELFVFGEAKYLPVGGLPPWVHQKNRIPLDALYQELLQLAAQYHFIGTSLIRPANKMIKSRQDAVC